MVKSARATTWAEVAGSTPHPLLQLDELSWETEQFSLVNVVGDLAFSAASLICACSLANRKTGSYHRLDKLREYASIDFTGDAKVWTSSTLPLGGVAKTDMNMKVLNMDVNMTMEYAGSGSK